MLIATVMRLAVRVCCVLALSATAIGMVDPAAGSSSPAGRCEGSCGRSAIAILKLQASGAIVKKTAWGWVVGSNPAATQRGALELRKAVEVFFDLFDTLPGNQGLVVDLRVLARLDRDELASFDWTVPWLFLEASNADSADAEPVLDAQASKLLAHLVNSGLLEPSPELDRVVGTFVQGSDTWDEGAIGHTPKLQVALRHEIAHKLFIRYSWPNTRSDQYGGDAPDWLDEIVAIAAEPASLTERRRKHFAGMVQAGRVLPLSRYLRQTHPTYASPKLQEKITELRRQAKGKGGAIGLYKRSELGLSETQGPDFYAQTLAFLDFMIEAAQGTPPIASIAGALRAGRSFEVWLKDAGEQFGLASDIDALDAQFEAWSVKR